MSGFNPFGREITAQHVQDVLTAVDGMSKNPDPDDMYLMFYSLGTFFANTILMTLDPSDSRDLAMNDLKNLLMTCKIALQEQGR